MSNTQVGVPIHISTLGAADPRFAESHRSASKSALSASGKSTATAPVNRAVALDVARLLAVIGVLWIHACQTPQVEAATRWGRFAVPFFAAAAAFLAIRSLQRHPATSWQQYARSRVQRLYGPFLIWSLLYVAFRMVKSLLVDRSAPNAASETSPLSIDFFWTGGAYHLWFIPYLLLASLLIFALVQWVNTQRVATRWASTGAFACGLTLAYFLNQFSLPDDPLVYMLMATPGLCWGMALAWLPEFTLAPPSNTVSRQSAPWIIALVALGCGLTAVLLLPYPPRNAVLENLAGIALLIAALRWPILQWPGNPQTSTNVSAPQRHPLMLLGRWGQLSMGIYFSHLLFLKVTETALDRVGSPPAWTRVAILMTVTLLAATATSWLLARFRMTRPLVA